MTRLSLLILLGLGSIVVPAQAQEKATPSQADSSGVARTIELAIADKHIVEEDLYATTALTLRDEGRGGLDVFVGAGLQARRLDLRLQGVYGLVRFRADAAALRERLHLIPRP